MRSSRANQILATLLLWGMNAGAGAWGQEDIRWLEPDQTAKTSAAVVVNPSVPLVHTEQVLPFDARGEIVVEDQADAVLDRLETLLQAADSGFERLVRIHVYASTNEELDGFRRALSKRLEGHDARPAWTAVLGALPHPEARIAADVIATSSVEASDGALIVGKGWAILPKGARVFVSGQAEPAEDLVTATRTTMVSLLATLDHLGLDRSSIVQLKAFLNPMSQVDDARRVMAEFFEDQAVPPMVFVEWESSLPIEIELVAAGGATDDPSPNVEYLTPPGMSRSPIFSRVARVPDGPLVFTSSRLGTASTTGAEQTEAIFKTLQRLLNAAGSDLRHLVKATYYVSDEDSSRALNEIRPNYYDPQRPPAASKAMVQGVEGAGRTIALDLIAVSIESATD